MILQWRNAFLFDFSPNYGKKVMKTESRSFLIVSIGIVNKNINNLL